MGDLHITIEERVVLFTDVHNYYGISHALGADAHGFLQEMYEKLGDIIVEHGGKIVKYLGDAGAFQFGGEISDNRGQPIAGGHR